MTQMVNLVDMLVKTGMTVSEAWEAAEIQTEAENLYIDCAYEEEFDEKCAAFWDEYEREHREYYESTIKFFRDFEKEHIEGKSIEEISPEDWDFYSDWHKDIYGFRPR